MDTSRPVSRNLFPAAREKGEQWKGKIDIIGKLKREDIALGDWLMIIFVMCCNSICLHSNLIAIINAQCSLHIALYFNLNYF